MKTLLTALLVVATSATASFAQTYKFETFQADAGAVLAQLYTSIGGQGWYEIGPDTLEELGYTGTDNRYDLHSGFFLQAGVDSTEVKRIISHFSTIPDEAIAFVKTDMLIQDELDRIGITAEVAAAYLPENYKAYVRTRKNTERFGNFEGTKYMQSAQLTYLSNVTVEGEYVIAPVDDTVLAAATEQLIELEEAEAIAAYKAAHEWDYFFGTTLDPKNSGWNDFWNACNEAEVGQRLIGDCVGTVFAGIGMAIALPIAVVTVAVGASVIGGLLVTATPTVVTTTIIVPELIAGFMLSSVTTTSVIVPAVAITAAL